MGSQSAVAYCPWCTGGIAPDEDAQSQLCFAHFTELLGQLAERRWRRRRLGSHRLHQQFPTDEGQVSRVVNPCGSAEP